MSLCVSRRNPDPARASCSAAAAFACCDKNARQSEPGLNQILAWI
jgi:hypothetical protein